MYYVYVLKNQKSGYYIGYTDDLDRRMREHESKGRGGLAYYEAYQSSDWARARERKLKQYGSAWRALKKRIA
jgi:putative endonuclease